MGVGESFGRSPRALAVAGSRAGLTLLRACLAEDRAAAPRHAGEHHPAAGRGRGLPLVPQGAGPGPGPGAAHLPD